MAHHRVADYTYRLVDGPDTCRWVAGGRSGFARTNGCAYEHTMTPDEAARLHMRSCPDHEVIVDTDDQWHCLTCEGRDNEPAGWAGVRPRTATTVEY